MSESDLVALKRRLDIPLRDSNALELKSNAPALTAPFRSNARSLADALQRWSKTTDRESTLLRRFASALIDDSLKTDPALLRALDDRERRFVVLVAADEKGERLFGAWGYGAVFDRFRGNEQLWPQPGRTDVPLTLDAELTPSSKRFTLASIDFDVLAHGNASRYTDVFVVRRRPSAASRSEDTVVSELNIAGRGLGDRDKSDVSNEALDQLRLTLKGKSFYNRRAWAKSVVDYATKLRKIDFVEKLKKDDDFAEALMSTSSSFLEQLDSYEREIASSTSPVRIAELEDEMLNSEGPVDATKRYYYSRQLKRWQAKLEAARASNDKAAQKKALQMVAEYSQKLSSVTGAGDADLVTSVLETIARGASGAYASTIADWLPMPAQLMPNYAAAALENRDALSVAERLKLAQLRDDTNQAIASYEREYEGDRSRARLYEAYKRVADLNEEARNVVFRTIASGAPAIDDAPHDASLFLVRAPVLLDNFANRALSYSNALSVAQRRDLTRLRDEINREIDRYTREYNGARSRDALYQSFKRYNALESEAKYVLFTRRRPTNAPRSSVNELEAQRQPIATASASSSTKPVEANEDLVTSVLETIARGDDDTATRAIDSLHDAASRGDVATRAYLTQALPRLYSALAAAALNNPSEHDAADNLDQLKERLE